MLPSKSIQLAPNKMARNINIKANKIYQHFYTKPTYDAKNGIVNRIPIEQWYCYPLGMYVDWRLVDNVLLSINALLLWQNINYVLTRLVHLYIYTLSMINELILLLLGKLQCWTKASYDKKHLILMNSFSVCPNYINEQCTLYSPNCTLYSPNCTLYFPNCTQHFPTVLCTLPTVHVLSQLYFVLCTLGTVHCTLQAIIRSTYRVLLYYCLEYNCIAA